MSKQVEIIETQHLGDGNSVQIRMRMSEQEAKEFRAKKQDQKNELIEAFEELARQELVKTGGKDYHPTRPHFEHPGDEELTSSLRSVTPNWRTVDTSLLKTWVPMGKPPSSVSTKYYQDVLVSKAQFLNHPVPSMRPVVWLELQMPKLRVEPLLIKRCAEKLGMIAFGRTEQEMWFRVVSQYNGFVKTIVELLDYVPTKKEEDRLLDQPNDEESEEQEEEQSVQQKTADQPAKAVEPKESVNRSKGKVEKRKKPTGNKTNSKKTKKQK